MADVTTKIAGQNVTLIDNGDGTYRIDLGTFAARQFIRQGELAQLREARDQKVVLRDNAVEQIAIYAAHRLEHVTIRDTLNAEIAALNGNIAELVAWLQDQGDVA